MAKFRRIQYDNLAFHCLGCNFVHIIDKRWIFNNDLNNPTINPSLLVREPVGNKVNVCHSFIREGKIQFLSDSTHGLAGKTVEIPDFETMHPDWSE